MCIIPCHLDVPEPEQSAENKLLSSYTGSTMLFVLLDDLTKIDYQKTKSFLPSRVSAMTSFLQIYYKTMRGIPSSQYRPKLKQTVLPSNMIGKGI